MNEFIFRNVGGAFITEPRAWFQKNQDREQPYGVGGSDLEDPMVRQPSFKRNTLTGAL